MTYLGKKWLIADGGMMMAFCVAMIALGLPWQAEFAVFIVLGCGFSLLHGCCIQVYVAELAPTALASAKAGHSSILFLGQATCPLVYDFGLSRGFGIHDVLIGGVFMLVATGWIRLLKLRRPALSFWCA